ncbi:RNA polymerase sigma factor [Chitinophaga alhagiae]|uniref:RNA polymerase sigma factor n=1 Tax=Chitinophaga alhagiae TaxID=2203219 RepID=UPI0021D22528|nr:sigma-70 family RNA polymerase sigma factor [Chitinophaga alhagiae]
MAPLLEGCQRQDRLCQEKLYMLFFDKMLAVVRRNFPDKDTAISILNNGFLRAFKKISQYSGNGSFEGWLRKIMLHAVADHFQANKAALARPVGELTENSAGTTTADPFLQKDLVAILQRLPPATRLVVNLFIIEGYSHKEIAAMLRISTGTSKWHVAEGKKLLKQLLQFPENQY